MTYPVQNNKNQGTDPYGSNYGDGSEYDQGFDDGGMGMEDPYATDGYYGEEAPAEAQGPMGLSDIEGYVDYLKDLLANSSLDDATKKDLEKQMKQLEGQAGSAEFLKKSSPEQYAATLQKIQENLSKIEGQINQVGQDGAEGGGSLKSQLEDFKKKVQENPNLTENKKKEFGDKIDKWLSTLELGLSEEMANKVSEEFLNLQEEYANVSVYSSATSSLSETTGLEPAQIEELAKKYGLDLNNLPNPPDGKVAALLNDPEFSATISSAKEAVVTANKDLKETIDSTTASAEALRSANRAQTTDVDNTDTTSFKKLQDLYTHKDDKSQTLANARKKVAEEISTVLSAMYGKPVTADSDPAHAGAILFDGTALGTISSNLGGDISFDGKVDMEWPAVNRVEWAYDMEGDGAQTPPPQWMKDAGYPLDRYEGTDDGGTDAD